MIFISKLMIISNVFVIFLLLLLKSDYSSPAELIGLLMQIGYTFGSLFAYCEFGERVTHQFNQFNENFCNCDWFSFPIEMQRIYLLVLVGVQDPVIIRGYAHTVCTRDAFKRVIFFRNMSLKTS